MRFAISIATVGALAGALMSTSPATLAVHPSAGGVPGAVHAIPASTFGEVISDETVKWSSLGLIAFDNLGKRFTWVPGSSSSSPLAKSGETGDFSWFPDGRRILYALRGQEGTDTLVVKDVTTGQESTVCTVDGDGTCPQWGFAFSDDQHFIGMAPGIAEAGRYEDRVVAAALGANGQINSVDALTPYDFEIVGHSSNGARVLVRSRQLPGSLYTIDAASLAVRPAAGQIPDYMTNYPGGPAVAPDASKIALLEQSSGDSVESLRVVVLNVDTGKRVCLKCHWPRDVEPHALSNPAWSPNGRYLAYSYNIQSWNRKHPSGYVVYVTDTRTWKTRAILGPSSRIRYSTPTSGPIWSPDGRFLLVNVGRTGAVDAGYAFDMRTSAMSLVTSSATGGPLSGQSFAVNFSTDGKYVIFRSFSPNLRPNGALFIKRLSLG